MILIYNLSDLNLNNDLETLDLFDSAVSLERVLYSYLWRSDASPKNLQIILSDVRTFIKLNYRKQSVVNSYS
jgi:hypothetical protein